MLTHLGIERLTKLTGDSLVKAVSNAFIYIMMIGFISCVSKIICNIYLLLLCSNGLVRGHLEHQYVQINPNDNGNETTFNPYANYDPKEGMTTALILGGSFLLIIGYIAFKIFWKKFQKKWCCKARLRYKDDMVILKEANLEQQIPIPNLKEKCLPITVREAAVGDDVFSMSSSPLNMPQKTASQSASLNRAVMNNSQDKYATILSESTITSDKATRRAKSRSRSSSSPEKNARSCHNSSPHILPPAVNQVLRTAHWVNSVTNEMNASIDAFDEDFVCLRRHHVIEAEINHLALETTKTIKCDDIIICNSSPALTTSQV